jgi:hypothetical protein
MITVSPGAPALELMDYIEMFVGISTIQLAES